MGNSKDFDELTPTNNDIKWGFSNVASESASSVRDSYSEPITAENRERVKSVQKVFENATLAKDDCWRALRCLPDNQRVFTE